MILGEPNLNRESGGAEFFDNGEVDEHGLNSSDREVVEGFKTLTGKSNFEPYEKLSGLADRVLEEARYGNLSDRMRQVVNLHMFSYRNFNPRLKFLEEPAPILPLFTGFYQ